MACKIRNLTDSAVQSAITNVVVKTAGKYKPEGTTLSIDTKDFSLEELNSIVEKWSTDTYKTAAFTNNWFTVNETPDKVVINFTAPNKLVKAYEVKLGIKSLDQVNNELMGLDEDVSLAQQPITTIKPGVSELFDSNPELQGNQQKEIKESDITYTDENGNPCAKMGLTNTTKGTGWQIVKDFKGQPKHSQGGVDISISDKGVSMRRGGKDIKAAHGLLIPATIMAQDCLVVDGGDDKTNTAKKEPKKK